MPQRVSILKELDGANLVDGMMSTWLAGTAVNWKNLQGEVISAAAK